jgi:hypothetical protein
MAEGSAPHSIEALVDQYLDEALHIKKHWDGYQLLSCRPQGTRAELEATCRGYNMALHEDKGKFKLWLLEHHSHVSTEEQHAKHSYTLLLCVCLGVCMCVCVVLQCK